MALVTVRSPSIAASPTTSSNSDAEADDDEGSKKESRECFFAGKGTALLLSLKDAPIQNSERRLSTDSTRSTNSTQSNNSDIQQHLQSMFDLLRHEATLKMAVKLESQRQNRTRYLVIASRFCYRTSTTDRKTKVARHNSAKVTSSTAATTITVAPTRQLSMDSHNSNNFKLLQQSQTLEELTDVVHLRLNAPTSTQHSNRQSMKTDAEKQNASGDNKCTVSIEESCLLGIDCNERTTIGLVVPILADTTIHLDGDGGFSVSVFGKTHIFKPVSVQAMWSALQTLHKVSQKARENNCYPSGPSHDWCSHYASRIESDQSCLNEWNAMDSIESRRPPSPDAIRNKPTAKEETESVIKMKLKEIMMSVDLDEVTSKYIRSRLEEQLDMDLGEYKSFIDEEMLMILGQMDAPTEIFEHVYLGSEWNASNLEELQKNGVRHILNVTREIDNFFPGMFDYFNVRVYDDEKTNLLKHWDNTYRYITRAKAEGSKVLVHCKMGVSRSASVVIAYAMKAYNWEFEHALQHVKERRNCIKPNKNFLNQLETYRGMLDAMKNKEKLQRSKSETNLKSTKDARLLPGSEPTPLIQALNQSKSKSAGHGVSEDTNSECLEVSDTGVTLRKSSSSNDPKQRRIVRRSSSTSPKSIHSQTAIVIKQQSQSLENLTPERSVADEPKNVRFPGSNGENYSVTQNQVLHIQKHTPLPPTSVRTIIQDLETFRDTRKTVDDRRGLNLQFNRSTSQDTTTSRSDTEASTTTATTAQGSKSLGSPVWTSSAKLITQTSNLDGNSATVRHSFRPRRDTTSSSISSCETGDAFSAQVDNVFAKEEEKRQRRKTHSWAATSGVNGGIIMDSAQTYDNSSAGKLGSTSSIDSASSTATTTTSGGGGSSSVIGANAFDGFLRTRLRQRELPSRHASWGSGDNRCGVPIRNSSWGSYDTNRNTFQYGSNGATAAAIFEGQIHELNMSNKTVSSIPQTNVGTIKRTKQKLEESTAQKKLCQENAENETSVVSSSDNVAAHKRNSNLYRSASAAGTIRSRYPQRCNSEEFVPTTGCTAGVKQIMVRRSDGSKPLPADLFSASAPDTYTMSDIENKNTVPQENDEAVEDDEYEEVVLRSSNNLLLTAEDQRISGNVQILKKSFEAKAGSGGGNGSGSGAAVVGAIGTAGSSNNSNSTTSTQSTSKKGHQSLPSSPVAQHVDHSGTTKNATNTTTAVQTPTTNFSANCDRNVKVLVHKYQATTTASATVAAATLTATNISTMNNINSSNNSSTSSSFKPRPRSYYDNSHTHKLLTGKLHEYSDSRPPPAPAKTSVTIVNDSHLSATHHQQNQQQHQHQHQHQQQQQRRQQHGKTHPLARLSLPKQSFNTAAYNTM